MISRWEGLPRTSCGSGHQKKTWSKHDRVIWIFRSDTWWASSLEPPAVRLDVHVEHCPTRVSPRSIKWLPGSGNVTDVQSDSYHFLSTRMLRWFRWSFVTLNSSDFVGSALRHLVNQIITNWMHRGRVWKTTSLLNLSMFLGHSMPKSMNAFCIWSYSCSLLFDYYFSNAASDRAAESPIKTSQLTAITGHVASHAWHGGHCDAYSGKIIQEADQKPLDFACMAMSDRNKERMYRTCRTLRCCTFPILLRCLCHYRSGRLQLSRSRWIRSTFNCSWVVS